MSLKAISRSDSQFNPSIASCPEGSNNNGLEVSLIAQNAIKRVRGNTSEDPLQHVVPVQSDRVFLEQIIERKNESKKKLDRLICLMGAIIVTAFFSSGYLILQSQKKG